MTNAELQALIDACKAAGNDPTKVEWDDLSAVLSAMLPTDKSEYNILDYGGVADGVTNNATAATAAIADMPEDGGVLFFPGGDWAINSQVVLNKNIIVRGVGQGPFNFYTGVTGVTGYKGATNIICNSGSIDLFLVTDTGTNVHAVRGFENISIYCSAETPTSGSGINITGRAQNTYFDKVTVKGFYNNVDMVEGIFCWFENCRFIDPKNAALLIDNSSAPDEGGYYFANCFFIASQTTGRNPNYGIYWKGGGAIVITGCNFNSGLNYSLAAPDETQNFKDCLYMDFSSGLTSDIFITNNVFENYRERGIHIDNTIGGYALHVNINGNTLSPYSDNYANIRSAIELANLTQVNVYGNTGTNLGSISYPFINMTNCTNSTLGMNTSAFYSSLYGFTSCSEIKLPQSMSVSAAGSTTGTFSTPLTDISTYTITPTGDCTFNATGGLSGQQCSFVITTTGTTSRTLTFGTNFKSQGILATGILSGKVFTVTFIYDGTSWNEVSRTIAM